MNKARNKIAILVMSLLLLIGIISATFAWFSGLRYLVIDDNTENPIATLSTLKDKVDVEGFDSDGQKVTDFLTDDEYDEYALGESENWVVNKLITNDLFTPGAINKVNRVALGLSANDYQNRINEIIANNTNTKYFKVTNRSNMDIMVKTEFAIGLTDYDVLTSFWYLITDVTSQVNATAQTANTRLENYALNNRSSRSNSFNENNIESKTFNNLDSRITLGEIDEPGDYSIGNTKYFRLDYGLTENALRASGISFYNRNIGLDIYVFYGQVNAPDEGGDIIYDSVRTVSNKEQLLNLLENVNLAYPGDKILFLNDIIVDDQSVIVDRPLNFDLNGFNLTVNGNLEFTYNTAYNATIDITRTSQIDVVGDIKFNTPNASISLYGDNEKAAGVGAYDIRLTGTIFNGVGHINTGLLLSNVYIIYHKLNPISFSYTNELPNMEMSNNSLLTVGENVEIGTINTSEVTGVYIDNYGSIKWVNLVSMILRNIQGLQIKIYNDGILGDINAIGGAFTNAVTLPTSSTISNTQIIKGIHSNSFTVTGSRNFTDSNVVIEGQITEYVTRIENEANAYRVYLDQTVVVNNTESKVEYVLEQYFSTNPDLIKQIEKLVIVSPTDIYINQYDFNYMKSDELRDLNYLDLLQTHCATTNYMNAFERYDRIPDNAMYNKNSLTTLILPETIKYIGTEAFVGTQLRTITIPASIERIYRNAFSTVTEVVINKFYPIADNNNFLNGFTNDAYFLVNELSIDTFKTKFVNGSAKANKVYCYGTLVGKHYIRILENSTIEIVAYTGDINDTDITPRTIEYNGITYLVSSIGRDAYINISNNQAVTVNLNIGEGTTYIGKRAFYGLPSIQAITISSNITIDERAFYSCSFLERLTIIGNGALNSEAFSECRNLVSVVLDQINSIDDRVFSNCVKITELRIPNVTYLGDEVFRGCTLFEFVELGGIETIKSGTFNRCLNLYTVILNENTKYIDNNAFNGCMSLRNINLDKVERIGNSAFLGCVSLTKIVSNSLLEIGNNAFEGCANLEYIIVPNVISIGNRAFFEIEELVAIDITNTEVIGNEAFYYCSQLKYLYLDNVTQIGQSAFHGCSQIVMIKFSTNPRIGTSAFKGVKPRYLDFTNYDFSEVTSSNYQSLSEGVRFGNSNNWHFFNRSTIIYISSGEYLEERKTYLYNILKSTYLNINLGTYRDVIYEKTLFAGDDIFSTSDGAIEVNFNLYCIKLDENDSSLAKIVAYHGPALKGNVVIPFNEYYDQGLDTLGDFNTETEAQTDTYAIANVTIAEAYNGQVTYYDNEDIPHLVTINKIGENAFFGITSKITTRVVDGRTENVYTRVRFASSITIIEKNAFRYCDIHFAYLNNVTEVQESVFRNSLTLRYVDLEDVTTIGDYAFSDVLEGRTVDNNYNYYSASLSLGMLTKVMFRHVDVIGTAAFIKGYQSSRTNLLLLDFTTNINGAGDLDRPRTCSNMWGAGEIIIDNSLNYSYYDTYVIIPFATNQDGTINVVQTERIKTRYREITSEYAVLQDAQYVYNPTYKVYDVEVGMYILRPYYVGNTITAFTIAKSFTRELGTEEIPGLTLDRNRGEFIIPGTINTNDIYVKSNGSYNRLDTNTNYVVMLGSNSFRCTTVEEGIYLDLYLGDGITEIPSNCFVRASFANVYLNDVRYIYNDAFHRTYSLGTVVANKLERIYGDNFSASSVKVLDFRENKDDNGDSIIVQLDNSVLLADLNKKIYVNEEDYEAYIEETRYLSAYNSTDERKIELYAYLQISGFHVGTIELRNTETLDVKSIVSPIVKEGESIRWVSVDEEGNNSDLVLVDDGIISTNYSEAMVLDTLVRTYPVSGSSYISCIKTTSQGETLLCKFLVNINTTTTTINNYNLVLDTRETEIGDQIITERGFKIMRYNGTEINGIFNPTEHMNDVLVDIMTSYEMQYYFGFENFPTNKIKVFELGIASYTSIVLDAGQEVYLVTDENLTEIGDFSFFEVSFMEAWLINVTRVGRKAFFSGEGNDNLLLLVAPNIVTIEEEGFIENRSLEKVIIGQNSTSYLTNIGVKSFDNTSYLKQFGFVSENISALYCNVIDRFNQTNIYNYVGVNPTELHIIKNITYNEEELINEYEYMNADDALLYLPDSLQIMSNYAFNQSGIFETVRLPINNVFNAISPYTFAYCKKITCVLNMCNIKTISNNAFADCELLANYLEVDNTQVDGIDLRGVNVIGSEAFRNNYSITTVYFDNLTSMGTSAFSGSINFRYGYFDANNPTANVIFGANWNYNTHPLSRYYVTNENKSFFTGIANTYVKDIVTSYNDGEIIVSLVYDDMGIILGIKINCYNGDTVAPIPTELTIDGVVQPVVSIGKYAYKGYVAPVNSTVTLPLSISTIEDYAFADYLFDYYVEDYNSENIIPTTYGSYVFSGNRRLENATFHRMAEGGDYFYNNCSSLTTMDLQDNYNAFGAYAAPIVNDYFFTNSKPTARCYIKPGTIDMFESIGYIGRVFEASIICGDYSIKYIDSNTHVSIVRYNVDEITENYTIPTELNGKPVTEVNLSAYGNLIVRPNATLTIPSNIVKIDKYAFYNCNFSRINIEGTNIIIDDYAFANNILITTIDLSNINNLTGIGVFEGNIKLNSVTFSNNTLSIPDYFFANCTNLNNVNLMNIENIGNYAFANCTLLSNMYGSNDISEPSKIKFGKVYTIGDYAFSGCSSIQYINFKVVNNIGSYAFRDCTSLASISNIANNPTLNTGLFYGCTSLTAYSSYSDSSNIVIPSYAFYNCTSLEALDLTNASRVGEYAFYNCTSLESLDLKEVTYIDNYGFANCSNLTSVDLGRVTTIGAYSFNNCNKITSIDLAFVETIGIYGFANCNLTGTLDLKNVRVINNFAFMNNALINNVIFRQVTTIQMNVFQNDIYIEELDFSENYALIEDTYLYRAPTTIHDNAFNGINNTFILYIPVDSEIIYVNVNGTNRTLLDWYRFRTNNTINNRIFEKGRISIENPNYMVKDTETGLEILRYLGSEIPSVYTVPASLDGVNVTSIGRYAFYQVDPTLNTFTLDVGINITTIKEYAFYNCQFENLALPNVTNIKEYAFYGNNTISYLSLPSAISIGERAFAYNGNLQIVRFYSCLRTLSSYVFDMCQEIRNVYLEGDTIPEIQSNPFGTLDESAVSIKVPENKVSEYKVATNWNYYKDRIQAGIINDADFSYRSISLSEIEIIAYEGQATSVVIPSIIGGMNVVKILDSAFCNSMNLEMITIPSSIQTISSSAFAGNYTIKNIVVNEIIGNVNYFSTDGVLYKCEDGQPTVLVYYPIAKNDVTYRVLSSSHEDGIIIYENAFFGNTYLEEVIISSSVKYIGESAFISCPSLTRVTFAPPASGLVVVPVLYGTNIFDTNSTNLRIYVPTSALSDFKDNVYFKYYKHIIEGN